MEFSYLIKSSLLFSAQQLGLNATHLIIDFLYEPPLGLPVQNVSEALLDGQRKLYAIQRK